MKRTLIFFMALVITRRLPQSNKGRKKALDKAKQVNDALPLGTVILHPNNAADLNSKQPTYSDAMAEAKTGESNLIGKTGPKNDAVEEARLFEKSFVEVFDSGVRRKKYVRAHRDYYVFDVDNFNLPP